jgi:hypothetical protein
MEIFLRLLNEGMNEWSTVSRSYEDLNMPFIGKTFKKALDRSDRRN